MNRMAKKPDVKQNDKDGKIQKIWCPDRESFQYINACNLNCRKKDSCQAWRDYLEPKLF